jgi:hypothetical protein
VGPLLALFGFPQRNRKAMVATLQRLETMLAEPQTGGTA